MKPITPNTFPAVVALCNHMKPLVPYELIYVDLSFHVEP